MRYNGNRFSVYESEEKTVLGLLDELGSQVNHNTDNLKNKTDLHGDHKGSWQGLSAPTLSDEGMRATVEDIIDNKIPSIKSSLDNLNSSLDNKANEVDLQVERARIDLLTKIESGETEGNTELLDIRVGADGIVYDSAGQSIREQIKSIKEDFGNYVDIVWIENSFIHSWGTVMESDSYDCTDFISYSSKLKYKVRTKMSNDLSRLAYYDSSKKLIKSVNLYSPTLTEFDLEQIENCAYVRFSFFKGTNKTDSHNACYLKVVSIANSIIDNAKQISKLEKEVNENKNPSFWGYAISKVILIGDSLTSGAYPTEDWGADASPNDSIAQNIPYYLKRMLNLDSVVNAGRSGYSASEWYKNRIENQPNLYNFAEYDTAIIWLGTNNGLTDTIDTNGTEANYYKKIIERIKEQNPDCFIILVKVFASKGDVTTTNTIIDKLAMQYRCLVIDNSDLTVANYPQLHVNNETNNPHFGKAGNIFVANRYATQISKYLGESPIRCEFGMSKRTDG